VDAELLENPDTAQALQILEKSAYSESQLYAYEYFWDAVVNERVAIEGSYKKGHAEGHAEGEAKGHIEDARKMKAKGYAIEDIADITGLSSEEIAKL